MKAFITALFVLANFIQAYSQSNLNLNMTKLGTYSDSSFTPTNIDEKYNAVWGYTAPNGKEYGIFGSKNFTYFVDITNGNNPRLVNKFAGAAQNVNWREFKTYLNYAYGVNDGGNGSLQIFDLQYLPDSVVKVYDSNLLIKKGHTLYIENGKLYNFGGTINNNSAPTITILDLTVNPVNPTLLANYTNPNANYIHDGFLRNDTLYAFSGFSGLVIYDVSNPLQIDIIGEFANYPFAGYCHSGWLTEDSKNLVMADEVPTKLPMKIIDVSNLNNITYLSSFRTPNLNSTPHNPHVKGKLAYISYYQDGVQVFDVSDPLNVVRVAGYDTYPDGDGDFYYGCWGVYPFFSSGKIIASDRKYGLVILDGTKVPGTGFAQVNSNVDLEIYPSPFEDKIFIQSENNLGKLKATLLDSQGKVIAEQFFLNILKGEKNILFLNENLSKGIYLVKVESEAGVSTRKLLKN